MNQLPLAWCGASPAYSAPWSYGFRDPLIIGPVFYVIAFFAFAASIPLVIRRALTGNRGPSAPVRPLPPFLAKVYDSRIGLIALIIVGLVIVGLLGAFRPEAQVTLSG